VNIIVVGCGRVGAELAYRLSQQGHQVTVVDQEAESFENLPSDFQGRMVEGEALAQGVLLRAGVEQADGLAAVTDSDTLNAAVGHIARTVYGVPNVVARNYNWRRRALYEAFGLQVISPTSWGARRIEELLCSRGMRTIFSVGNGEVGIYELVAPEAWRGRLLRDVVPEGDCRVVALSHAGQASLPAAHSRVEAGDLLYLSATPEGIERLLWAQREDTPQAEEG
jgi:trk system potassium uptake protein TrkA